MPLDPQVVAVTIRSYYAGVHETSIVANVRSRFGCSERTVRRCIAGLNVLKARDDPRHTPEALATLETMFRNLGGGDPYLRRLWRRRDEFLRTRERREGGDPWRAHQQSLSEALERLGRIDGLGPRDAGLAAWLASPSATWPLSEAVGTRDGDDVTVQLNIAEEPLWGTLHAHIQDEDLWTAVENRMQWIRRDLQARIGLFRAIEQRVELPRPSGGLGMPVTTDKTVETRATAYYVFGLLAVFLTRRLYRRQPLVHELELAIWPDHSLHLGSRDAVFSPDQGVLEFAKKWFLQTQRSREWGNRVELSAAAWAYEEGRRTAKELQDALERVGLDPAYLARRRCQECEFWADPT